MGRATNFSEEIEQKAIYNYLELHQGLQTAGKPYGISQHYMEKILKEYGIKKRTYTEAKQIGRKYTCNDNYFKTQSENMAYILGLLAADGNISVKENLIAIQLLQTDEDILQKIQQETQIQRPIDYYIRKNTGHKIATLRNWSAEWKKDLAHYGIIPQKTFSLQPPTFLTDKYYIDYIRGYFDGDGCISYTKTQNRTFFILEGASKPVMEWMHDVLINQYHILANKMGMKQLPSGTCMYSVKVGSIQELKKLYILLYQDKELFLERKKEKFETLLNIPRDSNPSN